MQSDMNPQTDRNPQGGMNASGGRADLIPSDTPGEIANPQTNSEVYYGSFSSILMQNQGQYVVVEFLVGTNGLEIKEGILYSSGINFLTLYDPTEDRYTVCDLYSVKFVTFYNSTTVPPSRIGQLNNSLPLNRHAETGGAQHPARGTQSSNIPSDMPMRPARGGMRRMF